MTTHQTDKSLYTAKVSDGNAVYSGFPLKVEQLDRHEARALFEYDDGRLIWKSRERRKSDEAGYEYYRKRTGLDPVWVVMLGPRGGQRFYLRRYLVWNYFYGVTDRELIANDGNSLNDRIENIGFGGKLPEETQYTAKPVLENAVYSETSPSRYGATCPCCGAAINSMTVHLAIQAYGITDQEARVLRAIWKGNGAPVRMDQVFFEMYSDDPDGGPPHTQMYNAFKVAMSHLRRKLEGSGIKIETVGYRQGYRLILERE
jgi:hypothetical protein